MLALIGLACSPPQTAGIVASPEPLVLDDQEPVEPRVYAVDLEQRELPEVPVELGPVQGEAVVLEGRALRCVDDGVALVELRAEHLARQLEVQCRLVKELRVPERLLVEPGPYAHGIQVIGQGGGALELPPALRSEDLEVATPTQALRPGSTTLVARAGEREARVPVVVGELREDRELSLQPGRPELVQLEPGRYLAQLEGEWAARLRFGEGPCGWSQGERTELECSLEEPGVVELIAITELPAEVRFRLWELAPASAQ